VRCESETVDEADTDSDENAPEDDEGNNDDTTSWFLEPCADYWASSLSYSMLDERRVFVFDFGAELYAWMGRYASRRARRVGWLLTCQVYNTGYDYTMCSMSPLRPACSNAKRPSWTIVGKQVNAQQTIEHLHEPT
jgi:hypothetical protein